MPAMVTRMASLTSVQPQSELSGHPVMVVNWLHTSSAAVGIITQVMPRRILSMPPRNSERTRVKRFASSASFTA